MKYLLSCLLLILTLDAVAQRPTSIFYSKDQTDILEVLVKVLKIKIEEKPVARKRISFSIIPFSTSKVGGKKILVSSFNAAFVIGDIDSTNVSNVYFIPYTDFVEDYGFFAKAMLWAPGNQWVSPVDFRILKTTQYSYGLGSSTKETDQFTLQYNNVRLYFSANHKIKGNFYGGLGINYDRYYDVRVSDAPTAPNAFEKYGHGTAPNSNSTGITFNILRDSRRNAINPDQGLYTSLQIRVNPSWLKNDETWSSVYLDSRRYFLLDPKHRKILALWGFYWGTFGNTPYLNLPGTQQEFGFNSGRGYLPGRFRGKHMLYLETEYRFDITRNGLFGGVVFANAQSLTEANGGFRYINPAVGFGARVKFNKESNTNITLDFGFGQNSFGFYLQLGEFF